jgi:cell division protein FtsN
MAARKGKGRQAVRNRKGGFPGWGWAVIGIAVGVVAMVVLTRHAMLPMAPSGPQPNPQATVQGGGDKGLAPAESAPKKPQYDFYSVLSEKEVRIPDEQISAQARAEQQQKQQAAQQAQAAAAARQRQAANPNAPAAVTENIQAAPATALPAPAAGSGYLLQVGAFPNAADAEALKAKLALQGFVANVQTVQVGGQTFHRVRLGPYRSATELESVQSRLAGAGYKAIALKEGR